MRTWMSPPCRPNLRRGCGGRGVPGVPAKSRPPGARQKPPQKWGGVLFEKGDRLPGSDLQTAVMKTRMLAMRKVLGKFPRMVRDLANKVGKKVGLELVGEDTELDKSVIEEIGDPLVHLIRNAIDHGVETPEERRASGKL